jgi:hypothetical protein
MVGKPGRSGGRTSGTRHGNGAGYGGQAKGEPARAESGDREPFPPGNPGGPGCTATEKSAARAERIRRHHDNLDGIAFDATAPAAARVAASAQVLDRIEGKPVQRTINHHTADPNALTDAELAAIAGGSGEDIAAAEESAD